MQFFIYRSFLRRLFVQALSRALRDWEALTGETASEATDIRICGGISLDEGQTRVFVNKLDSSLGSLAACECVAGRYLLRLSLSTNQIEKLFPFSGMTNLQILSLGRNNIKKLEKLDDLAPTLQQLWVSYNQVSNLDGVLPLTNLEVLYMSNNQIKDWGEIEKLAALPHLREVLFVGNPIYEGMDEETARLNVIKRIPQIQKVDSELVTDSHRARVADL